MEFSRNILPSLRHELIDYIFAAFGLIDCPVAETVKRPFENRRIGKLQRVLHRAETSIVKRPHGRIVCRSIDDEDVPPHVTYRIQRANVRGSGLRITMGQMRCAPSLETLFVQIENGSEESISLLNRDGFVFQRKDTVRNAAGYDDV